MSTTDEPGATPDHTTPDQVGPDYFDLGPAPWTPTQPASQYVGPLPGGPADQPYTQPVDQQYSQPQPPTPPYGQPAEPQYGQPYTQPMEQPYGQPVDDQPYGQSDPGYQMYDPQAMTPMPPVYQPGVLVPGQVVQTPYGTFMVGPKSKLTTGLLGILLGWLGAGQFYRGNAGLGVAQLVVTFITCGAGALWGLIEGIMVLVSQPGSPSSLDSNGQIMT